MSEFKKEHKSYRAPISKPGIAIGREPRYRGHTLSIRPDYINNINTPGAGNKFKYRHYGKPYKLRKTLIRELVGYAPYEKRMLEMIKSGGSNSAKKMLKFGKRRLGYNNKRVKRKIAEMTDAMTNK